MSIVESLRASEPFRELAEEHLTAIAEISARVTYARGDRIFELGAASDKVYQLLAGKICLELPGTKPDPDSIVSTVGVGSLFGISPLVGSVRYTSTASCQSECEVIAIQARPFAELIRVGRLPGQAIMDHVARIYFLRYVEVLRIFRLW